MAYNEALVIAGGVAHVPIVITILKFLDSKTGKRYNLQKGAEEALAKKKAIAEAEAKAKAEEKAAAQAAAAAKAAEKAAAENAQEPQADSNE